MPAVVKNIFLKLHRYGPGKANIILLFIICILLYNFFGPKKFNFKTPLTSNGGFHDGEAYASKVNDLDISEKRDKIKEMMQHAWNGYLKYAWGGNDLKPVSKTSHKDKLFGKTDIGSTIVDALDTLYIMGMTEEFKLARNWVHDKLNFDLPISVSVFEMNIRYLGGLLSTHALTNDQMFLDKAIDLANRLEYAFSTKTGLPRVFVNLNAGADKQAEQKECSSLADVGTLHMEFAYLSHLTKNSKYLDEVKKIRKLLFEKRQKDTGLYFNSINTDNGDWCGVRAGIGIFGDSFYEYLLKEWLRSGDAESLQMFYSALETIEKFMLKKSNGGLVYLNLYDGGKTGNEMDHLSCFAGGLFILGATRIQEKHTILFNDSKKADEFVKKWLKNGEDITKTCHESYERTATGLGPETFHYSDKVDVAPTNHVYILRPETVESYFYFWRLTKNPIYRVWAWDIYEAIHKHCRVETGGFSGLVDVTVATNPTKDDIQQSFFLSETLKYLYLIFSEDDVLPLNKWVFNTEAHPLPILI